jgi:hypothetical protein
MSEDPVLLYNIALCYDRMDAYDDAISMLDRYYDVAPDSEHDNIRRRQEGLRIRKERAASSADDPELRRANPVQGSEPLVTSTADEPTRPADEPPRVFSPAAWALSGVAVVGFGTALGTGIASRRAHNRADCADGLCTDEGAGDAQTSRTLGIVADVGIAVGAIATVAVIAIVASRATKRRRMMAVTPHPLVGSGMGGAGMSVRF